MVGRSVKWRVESGEKIEKMNPVKEREITVRY